MIETTKTLRFTIPPLVFAFFIFLAQFFVTEEIKFLPPNIILKFSGDLKQVLTGAIAIVILVSAGFLFTSLTTLITRRVGWMQPKWNQGQLEKLKEISGLEADKDRPSFKNEFIEWCVHNEVPKNITDNIQKRWEWFQINLSSVVAVVFSTLYIWILNRKQICDSSNNFAIYIIVVIIFEYIFIMNAIHNYKDVQAADKFLLEYIKERGDLKKKI